VTDGDLDAEAALGALSTCLGPMPLGRTSARDEWIASYYRDVQAVLAEERFEVMSAPNGGPVGTVSWLRAAVSRFTNGAVHDRRRAGVVAELQRVDPQELRAEATRLTRTALRAAGPPGHRVDVMDRLARRIPMAAMAAALGISDIDAAAKAVIAVAAGYFPGSAAATQPLADRGTAQLVSMLEPADPELIVARIAILVQGCDATAGLIGNTLHILQESPTTASEPGWATEAVVREVARRNPPLRAIRRIAREPLTLFGEQLAGGDTIVCAVDLANQDPVVFAAPGRFDPARKSSPASLTFGSGVRPCPGQPQALMLAVGVIEAVRHGCTFLPGEPVEYDPAPALRMPRHFEVVLA
jgi:cytochrome P450